MQKLNFREYRGKRIDNREWVYGTLSFLILDGAYIIENGIAHKLDKDLTFGDLNEMVYKVIPESVGQFTGRCTENGDKFFEGDIVKRTCTEKITPMIGNIKVPCDAWEIGVVRYDNEFTGFEVSVFKQKDLWYGNLPHGSTLNHYDWQIIGNLTDTPELIEIIEV